MNLSGRVDINDLALRIQRYVNELGRSAPVVVKDTARRLIGDLLKITAPKNQAQGKKAIEGDINRAMTPFDAGKVRLPRLRKLIRERNYEAVNSIIKRSGGKWSSWTVVPFDPKHHTDVQTSRGRVRGSKKKFILDKPAWRKYVATIKDKVGKLKSGWNAAFQKLGGVMPAWISKHGSTRGGAIDATEVDGNPSFTIINQAKNNALITDSKISKAVDIRVRSMDTDIRKALERARESADL